MVLCHHDILVGLTTQNPTRKNDYAHDCGILHLDSLNPLVYAYESNR